MRRRGYNITAEDHPGSAGGTGVVIVWRPIQLVALALVIALTLLGGISLLRPFETTFSPPDDRLYHVTIDNGNLRVVSLTADFICSLPWQTPLGDYARYLSTVPTEPIAWERRTLCHHGADLHKLAVSFTLFAPLVILLFLMYVARPLLRQPGRLMVALQEILRPSDRQVANPFRRVIRRSLIAVFGVGALLAAGAWVISHTGLPSAVPQGTSWGGRPLRVRYDDKRLVIQQDGLPGSFFEIRASDGRFIVRRSSIVNDVVPVRAVEVGSFRWRQEASGSPLGPDPGDRPATHLLWLRLEFPCWAVFLLTSAWPVIAFIRGPWRRSGRRVRGLCLRCGYNLTGLVEPRCPECGTPTPPGQILIPLPAGQLAPPHAL